MGLGTFSNYGLGCFQEYIVVRATLIWPNPMDALRTEIKAWERRFLKQHGHKPQKSDIRADEAIYKKYRAYWKKVLPVPVEQEESPLTPHKEAVSEIGPTPQNCGRVRGIFDRIEFTTPVKAHTSIDQAIITPQTSDRNAPNNSVHFTPRYLDFATLPIRLDNLTDNDDESGDENSQDVISPLKKRSYLRSASHVVKELETIKQEMSRIDFSMYSQVESEDDKENQNENEQDSESDKEKFTRKYKTMKRQTRRVHLRPVVAPNPGDEPVPTRTVKPKEQLNLQRLKLRTSGYKTNRNKIYKGRR